MRLHRHLLLWGTLLFLSGCNKAANLARENSDDFRQASAVDGPSTEAKSDRPTEAGEGLPGYLIDPSKITVVTKDGTYTVTGIAGAVKNEKGESVSATITLMKIVKATVAIQKKDKDWELQGTAIVSNKTPADGSFQLLGTISKDEMLFLKAADGANTTITYSAANPTANSVWISGSSAKPLDAAVSDQIKGEIQSAADLAARVQQVKTTGSCKNCNLRGADLSSLEIPRCDLSFADLTGANLRNSNLGDCTLMNSNLSQVDFTQANLANANLTQTDITGAIFTGANVNGVIGQTIPQ